MEGLSQNEKLVWGCWEEKTQRDVVREAAAKGIYINLAIKYLMKKNSWDETVAREWFLSEVKEWTIQLLMRKQIFKVMHILTKVQINPEEHLMMIAGDMPQIEYRDFIVEHLDKISKDIKPENFEKWQNFKAHWIFLKHLEKSFITEGIFKQNKAFGILGEDRVIVTETEIKALTIEKVEKYPAVWKSKIGTKLFFETMEFSLLTFASPIEVWNYLVQQNKAMILVRWINVQMSEVVRDMNARYNFFNNDNFVMKLTNVDTKGVPQAVLAQLDDLFRKWSITEDMIATISTSDCFEYTKMCIYDTLCSYGVVTKDECNNLYQIILRLSRTQNLRLLDDVFSESCSTMTKQQFYVDLALYFVKNKLYKALTMCVEGHIKESDLTNVEQEAKECIELWLLFKSIEQTADRQSHVVPVYKTCQQIAKDDIDNYITANPHLVLGMILLEDNANLFDIFSKEDFLQFKEFMLPNKKYKDKLPHLYNVFMKYSQENRLYESKDVNVYQLLSGYRGLDVSKLFEFQLVKQSSQNQNIDKADRRSWGSLMSDDVNTNTVKSFSQRTIDMPDFANEKLMKRYGYVAKLNHVYYLKQYRPCNASQAFVAQQYQTYNRLQEKSIKSACCEAHALALQNWFDPGLSACAVSFIAMIGCNPARCRVHMSAAQMLKHHLTSAKEMSDESANKSVNEYMTVLLQSNDNTGKDILTHLEEATLNKLKQIKESDGKVDMATVLYHSQSMVKFALLHNLQLPEMQLREFVKNNSWFNFLLFGDVFRYPLTQMLQLSQEFEKRSYAEHLKYIMYYRHSDDGSDKLASGNGHRRTSRLSSVEVSPTATGAPFDFPPSPPPRELWEAAGACRGPEDPPAALLHTATACHEPLLVLVCSCLEPHATAMLWTHFIFCSLESNERVTSVLKSIEIQDPTADTFRTVAELCLTEGYVVTLHESLLVFMPENPLILLTSFLHRCLHQYDFSSETTRLLTSFLQHCQRKYSTDATTQSWQFSREELQKIAVSLIKINLIQGFDSAYHQREFLKCVAAAQVEKGLLVPSPNFVTLHEILQISMETSTTVSISKMLQDDCDVYLSECVEMYTERHDYDVAFRIAKLSGLQVNDILQAEWSHKYDLLHINDEAVEDKDMTYFIGQCSEAFKKAGVDFDKATEFLTAHTNEIQDRVQKFYAYRIIMSWYEENLEYGQKREETEHMMWKAYFESGKQNEVFLNSYQSTVHFVLHGQKDPTLSRKIAEVNTDKPFSSKLSEIEIESDVGNIENILELEVEAVDNWRKVVSQLLELKLLVEAFRLSTLFRVPAEYPGRSPAFPVQIFRTCLRLAEGSCSPYELPQELRLLISAPFIQNKMSTSETSDTSFEELVVIPDKLEVEAGAGQGAGLGVRGEGAAHLAARGEADRLAALDALAARSGITTAKQVASYYRIALQIGWDYLSVLKYQSHAMNFISLVSGRARMPLANLVFKTFNIPSKQIAEYLCLEMVAAIISPHLVKTSTFGKKEHFQYTLWGYTLSSDIEMFLNLRPDACSQIGRLILEHLMAFQRIYKATSVSLPENSLDDSVLDIETLIDEEYQNVESEEVNSAMTEDGTLVSADTESVASMSTMYTVGPRMTRENRRNLFDMIARTNVQLRYGVKSNIRKITKGAKLSTKQLNIIAIELLVLAHECFSVACDTEGVGIALRSAQALAARLALARSWRLLARTLTGLARYPECAYILQILRDNHQFEYLLGQFDYMIGQQPEKIAEFKQGLLDYLKTHCPGDTDTYIMVALHFNMYPEAADVKRKQAMDLIEDLEKISLDAGKAGAKRPPMWLQIHDNAATRSLLETALNHCTDAAELYLQGGCMGFAGEMAILAQQIALQISLLNASPTRLILNRSTEKMYGLVTEYLSFMEGLVLLAGRHGEAWRELAYRRALTNDQAYIRDMATYRPDVAHYIISRYKTEKNKTQVSQVAMTELRNMCR